MNEVSSTALLKTPEAVAKMVEALRQKPAIGVDTEFIRETTFFPKIALIQVATDEATWLLDPTVLGKEDLAPFLEVLQDPKILKIMHAAHSDQECFYTAYGFVVTPVLDTAIAAAITGYGDNVGLGRLLKEILNVHLPKGRARARWLQRPLPQELLDYAEQDVAHLVKLGEALKTQLESKGRFEWALEESVANVALFEMTPDDIAKKMSKSGQVDPGVFPVLLELVRWREDRARRADLPRGWVADNETLLALARVKPKSIEELRSFRGLNGREVEKSGNHILQAVARGKEAPRDSMPKPQRLTPRNENEDHVLSLIHSYVSFLAAKHEIATRFLLNSSKSFLLLLNAAKTPDEWVEGGVLSRHSRGLVGDDLKAFLEGKRGLSIRDGKVQILSL